MKLFAPAGLLVAALCFAAPAQALSLFGFTIPGAHNPTPVDTDAPNCTLFGPNSYANNPNCETVIAAPNGGKSIVTSRGTAEGGKPA